MVLLLVELLIGGGARSTPPPPKFTGKKVTTYRPKGWSNPNRPNHLEEEKIVCLSSETGFLL